MKVFFVCSGNKQVGEVSAFVQSQYESLCHEGIDLTLFPVRGKGWKSYVRAAIKLRHAVKKERPAIVHAHYSVCGLVATFATLFSPTKVVVSILGSFPKRNFKLRWVRFFINHVWNATIVKSQRTANQLGIELPVIPNGVNLEQFEITDQIEARTACDFSEGKKYIIWCSNPSREEKRFCWAEEAVRLLHDDNVILFPVYDKPHDEVVKYFCAADLLLLTSVSEGSPNVIKEAMACNCPIVSTDVGDVSWVTHGVEGTYIAPCGDTKALAKCIGQALARSKRTIGRERILELGLTTDTVAKKIISIYESI